MLALPDAARCRSSRAAPRRYDMRARSRRAIGLSEMQECREAPGSDVAPACPTATKLVEMADAVIDVWDLSTFDAELIAALEAKADLISDYLKIDREIFLSHDLGRGPRTILRPDNPHADNFLRLQEAIGREMQKRTIRAFHYTRLTDNDRLAKSETASNFLRPRAWSVD